MSRIARWHAEKTKVKVVFRLQFHATHIPHVGWDKLYISFIPADSGKTTAKTTKANVRNGTCKWADPIYETARLLQDIRTKQYDQKVYKLVLAMGSSRSSILGEATINLADFVDASKPSSVALPLCGSDTGAILHVTVQLLTSKTGFREFEQQRELREKGLQSGTDQNTSVGRLSSSEDVSNCQIDKFGSRAGYREKSEAPGLLVDDARLNEELADSAVGLDGSSNTSGSGYADKHEILSAHEVDSLKSTVSGELAGVSQSQVPQKGDHQLLAQGTHDWSSDCSLDNDFTLVYEENHRLRGCLEVAEASIKEFKLEFSSLQHYADEIGIGTQKLEQQLSAEIASREQFVGQVSMLKLECSKLRDELEKLENHKPSPFPCNNDIQKESTLLYHELEVSLSKGFSALEEKIREVQNKGYLGYHERDPRFFHSDLDELLEILQVLRQKSGDDSSGLNSGSMIVNKHEQYLLGMDLGVEPELGMLPCITMPGIGSPVSDSLDATNEMKNKVFELLRELDESKSERENLAKKMDQMECYYEALVQELEENQRQMLGELQGLRNEHSTCLYIAQSTKAEMETMRHRMDEQMLRFTEEKRDSDLVNKDLERRAITAEASLKRARLNYSISVSQLQKDLELLSLQVLSLFETNENLIRQASTENSQPNFTGYSVMKQNQNEAPKEVHAPYLIESQSRFIEAKGQHLIGDDAVEELKRSLCKQLSLYQKVEDESIEMLSLATQLDVYSRILQETLYDAYAHMRHGDEILNEVSRKLELSLVSEKLMMQRLETTMNDMKGLNECNATCISKCDDMALQKQHLEANLHSITLENQLFQQKISELEPLIVEYTSYRSKYEACLMEKVELANLLDVRTLENSNLENEVFSLNDELKMVRNQYDDMVMVHQNIKNTVDSSEIKLQDLMASYDKSLGGLSTWGESFSCSLGSKDLLGSLGHIEKLQNTVCEKIHQLLNEKENVICERNEAQALLSQVQTDMMVMKHKTEHEVQQTFLRLNATSQLVKKLESDIEGITEKVKRSSEVENCHVEQQSELLSDLEHLELELHELFTKNREFAQEILALNSINEELEKSKLVVAELTDENKVLKESLEHRTKETSKLGFEVKSSRETLQSFHDELKTERSYRDNLEIKVSQLTSQINQIQCQLLHFEHQESEMTILKQIISGLESERSKLCDLLHQSEECLKVVREQSSSSLMEYQLSEMCEVSIAADISFVFIRAQWGACTQDLEQQLLSCESHLMDFQKKHLDAEGKLSGCLTREAYLVEENSRLLQNLHSLKSELEASVSETKSLLNSNSIVRAELEDCKNKLQKVEGRYLEDKNMHDTEIDDLRLLFASSREDFDNLMILKEELEIKGLVLEAKLNEQHKHITLLEGYRTRVMQLQDQCDELNERLSEQNLKSEMDLENKHLDVEMKLNNCFAREAHSMEENALLIENIQSLQSELEASVSRSNALLDTNSTINAELKKCKDKLEKMELDYLKDKSRHGVEVEELKILLSSFQGEFDNLMLLIEELEINALVLKTKLKEQNDQITLLEGHREDVIQLQHECSELREKLSEQNMKIEEFKNLSIHLKELKDKAEAECIQAREKRDSEGPMSAVQESLRIAFIKEQYETRVHELKHQVAISKKHSEEMLLKLQDAVDEIENRRKSEASNLKKNEQLGMKILELEDELQEVISEKREKSNACDRMKAELECALISMECCKEEKEKIEAYLQECNEKNLELSTELSVVKGLLHTSSPIKNIEDSGKSDIDGCISGCISDEVAGANCHKNSLASCTEENVNVGMTQSNGQKKLSKVQTFGQSIPMDYQEADDLGLVQKDCSDVSMRLQQQQDPLESSDTNEVQSMELENQREALNDDIRQLAVVNGKTKSLRFSIDQLSSELERMKNENLLLSQGTQFDPKFPDLQKELSQLSKVNAELESIFPLSKDYSGSGNALERVFALELELADALQNKKKSSIQFQSSFLKQHNNDEEAIFKSFRDINELIRDMLDVKERYAAVETELKEMHERYSQLSLQFAEVEGERQKLLMTLKSVRASRKALQLNRSSSATMSEQL